MSIKKITPEKAFKGSFNVRIGADLHRDVAMKAQEKNMTINAFVKSVLLKEVANI
ncbi:MAG: toxin-antitoxin system HicB family antitoxin [Lachnospiraceae bacterium]|nr:toxin-antitoxin system HicB family antitoxin [Lachnospiraceae bacterium]